MSNSEMSNSEVSNIAFLTDMRYTRLSECQDFQALVYTSFT